MQQLLSRPAALVALAVAFVLALAAPARAEGWGHIKGQVVWADGKVPAPVELNVDKDKMQCLEKGKVYSQDLIVNPKNKGVKYVLVYLQDLNDSRKADFAPPIHPSYKNVKKTVEIDQPCCMFEPRLVVLREGQTLTVKNTMSIPHNFNIQSGDKGPNKNVLIPAGGQAEIEKFVAKAIPSVYSCTVHSWMRGYVATFKHPYFAVTDANGNFEIKNAPAGKYRLVFWHEKAGWVLLKGRDRGQVVEIKDKATTTLKAVDLKLPKD